MFIAGSSLWLGVVAHEPHDSCGLALGRYNSVQNLAVKIQNLISIDKTGQALELEQDGPKSALNGREC